MRKVSKSEQGRSEACANGAAAQGANQEGAQILRRNDLIIKLITLSWNMKYLS